jgi:integrase
MSRPRTDGTAADPPNRRRLDQYYVQHTRPRPNRYFDTWDSKCPGLVLRIQPTGHRSFYYFYRLNGHSHWYHLGNAATVPLGEVRKIVIGLAARIARGENPSTERRAERKSGTFGDLATEYVERYASKNNKSYRQAEKLVTRYLLPKWKTMKAVSIERRDVRAALDRIEAPVLRNQVLAAASAIFSWAIDNDILKINPCQNIKRNPVKSRDRKLSETEVSRFWQVFEDIDPNHAAALRLVLLTGQRPGEVSCMRRQDIEVVDGGAWWHLPGDPSEGWPGTKNGKTHQVWLSSAARAVLGKLPETKTGSVFGSRLHNLDETMRQICASLGIENKVTPHDLRRTCGSTITKLGRGRAAVDRILNHADHSITGVYDRNDYTDDDRVTLEMVGAHVMAMVQGVTDNGKVVALVGRK